MAELSGLTIAINAGDNTEVLDFYTLVFDRGPDTAPLDDFLEWEVCRGTWLQISTGHDRPGANNARVRFECDDIDSASARLHEAGVPLGEVVTVPDVVAFLNFSDNWGNALGFYQLLTPRRTLSEEDRREQEREFEARRREAEGEQAEAAGPEAADDDRLPPVPDDGSVPGQTGPTGPGGSTPSH
ncbi:VOC family protein [Agilicoccus flavus]|uniref:VOC family protein n=1 Tax=Agilicoccus flavus TaxID=2775968 RepID=UPI001CF60F3E|nr:VOC family protein [Agilicoccus flavus]